VSRNLSPLEKAAALQRELDRIRQTEPSRARSQILRDIDARIRRMEALGQLGNMNTSLQPWLERSRILIGWQEESLLTSESRKQGPQPVSPE
jgi:hypothetical protein